MVIKSKSSFMRYLNLIGVFNVVVIKRLNLIGVFIVAIKVLNFTCVFITAIIKL